MPWFLCGSLGMLVSEVIAHRLGVPSSQGGGIVGPHLLQGGGLGQVKCHGN